MLDEHPLQLSIGLFVFLQWKVHKKNDVGESLYDNMEDLRLLDHCRKLCAAE